MQTSLLDVVKGYLTSEVAQKASALVGESPADTKKMLEVAAPVLITGLADRASSPSGAQHLMGVLDDPNLHTTAVEGLTGGAGAMETLVQTGKDLLERALGGRLGAIVGATAGATGVKRSSIASILGLAAPLIFRVLGREVQTRSLDAGGLTRLLQEQKGLVARYLPAGLTEALGTGEVARAEAARSRPAAKGSAWWPLLLLIPVFIIGGLLMRKREAPRPLPERSFGAGIPETQPAPRPLVEVPLPTGPAQLHVGSVGQEIAEWLGSSSAEPSKRFVFAGLSFDSATSALMPASAATLDDVATVLKAYPNAHVALEGHTDASGNPTSNQQLSVDRANAVKSALVGRGVAEERITTAGFGQDRPITSNDTDEGRTQNRRTEIVITRH